MAKARAITRLEIHPAEVAGQKHWVSAEWQRADGSRGFAAAHVRWKTAERLNVFQLLIEPAYLRDVPVARIEEACNANSRIRDWIDRAFPQELVKTRKIEAAKRPRLKRPKSRRLDDEFFRSVAEAYSAAVLAGLPPGPTLAADSGTPLSTVHRWIAEARKPQRGYLPPGETGKATVTA
jgi:hypothetical protein